MERYKCDNCGRETDLVFETFGESYCAGCGTGKMFPLKAQTEPVAEVPCSAGVMPDVPNGYVLMPIKPTKEIVNIIAYSKYPEDWERGKRLQHEMLDVGIISPICECEIAAGQYERLIELFK